MSTVELGALVVLALACAATDLLTRRIPNLLNLVVLVAGVGFAVATSTVEGTLLHLAHFALALVAAMVLFRFGMWGGGDAKFYAAAAVWFPLVQAPMLALYTALAGVVLVLAFSLTPSKKKRRERLAALPYGMAIAAGAIALAIMTYMGDAPA
ncbi:A24 family peptidase [Aurantiacibacter luteus]|uniref:Prepilin type IV endopeptidase peptidase domain-containing protein n=1 Tax=Aurantiacibacter luteus TaxID=1581420 RepID=A0A0G9MKL8_9SPHN|nr:prepilin peptidase [Aurantiacibacter luteus]KLE31230.1 hypothetical protein AAW00_13750 [Aurantiacibacter luteus]